MSIIKKNLSESVRFKTVPVWDLPVRFFHWTLVLLLGISWLTGEEGGNAMIYHLWSGYAILTLLLFRLLWGFWGSTQARFSQFLYGPATTVCYALHVFRNKTTFYLGHNPLGGWMIIVLLIALMVQAGTGLFANDDIFIEGPLYDWVSKNTSDILTRIHKINFNILLVLVGVHVTAVFFYLFVKGENLITPMMTGRKRLPPGIQGPEHGFTHLWLAVLLLVVAATGVYLLVR